MGGSGRALALVAVATAALWAAAEDLELAHSLCIPRGPAPVGGYERYTGGVRQDGTVVLGGVPGYAWRHGCGPTAVAMVLGYWDGRGLPDLLPGDASSQTAAVNQAIASGDGAGTHYSDYAVPVDDQGSGVLADRSELGGAHDSNSLADFTQTSWSLWDNLYGWSRVAYLDDGVRNYVGWVNQVHGTAYVVESRMRGWGSLFGWDQYTAEIDAGRPVVLSVDSNADGDSDHFVAAIGYRSGEGGVREYACLDTWGAPDELRWEVFQQALPGRVFGVTAAILIQPELPPDLPIAGLGAAPVPVFPGGTTTISAAPSGPVDAGAIWVTDELGSVVGGSPALVSPPPGQLGHVIPVGLGTEERRWAHVAVENAAHPYDAGSPGSQLATQELAIDRSPEVGISLTPSHPVTGDWLQLEVVDEGFADSYEWTVEPPSGSPYGATGPQIGVTLDQSGQWGFEVVAAYAHEGAGGLPYQATAGRSLSCATVSAAVSVTPAEPFNTDVITLDGSASRVAAGHQVAYDWSVTGPSTFDGCPNAATCFIPDDTLVPGTHTVTLVVTDLDTLDQAVRVVQVDVRDGSLAPGLAWAPLEPLVGETVAFFVTGVLGVSSAHWEFGSPGCDGFQSTVQCVPGPYSDCLVWAYKFAAAGETLVRVWLEVGGFAYEPVSVVVTVGPGSCGPHLFSDGFEGGDASAWSAATGALGAPDAAFSFAPDPAQVGQTVVFEDQSTGPPFTWSWEFGDGHGSELENPTHLYGRPGVFTVSLVVANPVGSDVRHDVVEVVGP